MLFAKLKETRFDNTIRTEEGPGRCCVDIRDCMYTRERDRGDNTDHKHEHNGLHEMVHLHVGVCRALN